MRVFKGRRIGFAFEIFWDYKLGHTQDHTWCYTNPTGWHVGLHTRLQCACQIKVSQAHVQFVQESGCVKTTSQNCDVNYNNATARPRLAV